jgi:nitrate reductase beta subunit
LRVRQRPEQGGIHRGEDRGRPADSQADGRHDGQRQDGRSNETARADAEILEKVGLTKAQVDDMYQTLAIANYEDRYVIPTTHREYAENAFDLRSSCGFSFGNGCSGGASETSLFGFHGHKHGVKAETGAK